MSIAVTKYELRAYKDDMLVTKVTTENEIQLDKLADELRKNGYTVRRYDIIPVVGFGGH